ncbi:MAG: DUF4293 domain-containing protein [Alloprevotella sp.]|nr:DUF4293 domain-containing protein [Alloprevotella sp.]
MIQRIQSIWFFLAGLLGALSLFPTLARFAKDGGAYAMTAIGYQTLNLPPDASLPIMPWGVTLFSVVLCVLPLWTLFLYRNRRLQLRLAAWNVAAVIAWYATWVAYAVSFAGRMQTEFAPAFAAVLPFLSLVFVMLARRGVQKDEELVRAADRIR